jgi:hypothetical protein
LLRIEGINFDATVFDTRDLSTVRGSSFLYLDAITAIHELLEAEGKTLQIESVTRLSGGGSVGLFKLALGAGADDDTIRDRDDTIRDRIEEWLAGRGDAKANAVLSLCRHLAFAVDLVRLPAEQPPAAADPVLDDRRPPAFIRARERVIAANRVRQMQAPSVVSPDDAAPGSWQVCTYDLVRPAGAEKVKGEPASLSVRDRRGYGITKKQDWDIEVLQAAGEGEPLLARPRGYDGFARDFSTIADDAAAGRSLAGKIAVFYADGNRFSAIQDRLIRRHMPPFAAQQLFDGVLRSNRRQLLHEILTTLLGYKAALTTTPAEKADEEADEEATDAGKTFMRLEALYVAGDEGMWVVPASLGWTLAAAFFARVLGLDGETGAATGRKPWAMDDEPLHFAAGLVFCHHDAPISRIQRLAHDLADLAKAKDRGRSLMAYQVLESFDHIGRDLVGFRRDRCPAGTTPDDFILDGRTLAPVPKALRPLRPATEGGTGALPRRQLKRLATLLHAEGTGPGYAQARDRLMAEAGDALAHQRIAPLTRCFGDGPALWLHLDELWDFLAPPARRDAP